MYENIKHEIADIQVYISDLDEKHSETLGKIDIQPYEESEIKNWYTDTKEDGETFWKDLQEVCNAKGLDIVKDVEEVKNYINSLDFYVEVNLTVRKSKIDELKLFAEKLQ